MEAWNYVSTYLYGPIEETDEERYVRERRVAKLKILSQAQRTALLEDLRTQLVDFASIVIEKQNSLTKSSTMSSTDDAKILMLNDEMNIVTKVCDVIDKCCSHGLRHVEGEKDAHVKFFGLLKWTCARLAAGHQQRMASGLDEAGSSNVSNLACQLATSSLAPKVNREVRGFMACMRTANALANVKLDEGKTRAFLRQALNTHLLVPSLTSVLDANNEDLLTSYYTEFALFRNTEDAQTFLSLLDNLDDHSFGFMIDDYRLDAPPETNPFRNPLPKPVSQLFQLPHAELIDPEDMVDGRVRLCSADTETSLLAEKLVAHRQLGSNYQEASGGNPLADVLRRTQASQALDDAATAVLRFLEIGLPEYDVFGTSLLNVVCNPFLSGMARFDTSMGLPDVSEACVGYLHRKLSTPGLFQVHLSPDHVMDLRDAIEELGGIHKSMVIDPHEIIAVLLQYLWELPDGLLSEERWDSFVACGKLTNPEQRIRNVTFLVNDLPWSNKPLLDRLLHLCARALQPEYASKNGLDAHKLSILLSPILLRAVRPFRFSDLDEPTSRRFPIIGHTPIRHRLPLQVYGAYDENAAERAATEARNMRMAKQTAEEGAAVIQLLIEQQGAILTDFRKEMSDKRAKLQEKVQRMESIRVRLSTPIDLTNASHVDLLKALWNGLLTVDGEEDLSENWGTDLANDVKKILSSKRWKASGFHTEDPMGGFRGGGVLSLECMGFFVREYKEKAKTMMRINALPGGTRYPFPVACINVMRMMTVLLMVDCPPASTSRLVLHSETGADTVLEMQVSERVSRTTFWRVFDDVDAFEKLNSMAFMLLDLHWTRSGATQMGFNPVLDSTRRQMGWLLEQAPKNVEDMWKSWMQVREAHATKFSSEFASVNPRDSQDKEDDLAEQMELKLEMLQQRRGEYLRSLRQAATRSESNQDVDPPTSSAPKVSAISAEEYPETASLMLSSVKSTTVPSSFKSVPVVKTDTLIGTTGANISI